MIGRDGGDVKDKDASGGHLIKGEKEWRVGLRESAEG
jgi:hypothetical protein